LASIGVTLVMVLYDSGSDVESSGRERLVALQTWGQRWLHRAGGWRGCWRVCRRIAPLPMFNRFFHCCSKGSLVVSLRILHHRRQHRHYRQ